MSPKRDCNPKGIEAVFFREDLVERLPPIECSAAVVAAPILIGPKSRCGDNLLNSLTGSSPKQNFSSKRDNYRLVEETSAENDRIRVRARRA